jgi:hypothetical protein
MSKRASAKSSVEDVFETLYQNEQIETRVLKDAVEKRIPDGEKYRIEEWLAWRKESPQLRREVRLRAQKLDTSPERVYRERKAA